MADVDLTGNHVVSGVSGAPGIVKMSKRLDFSETNRAQNDVLQLFDVKAGWRVMAATVVVETEEGGTATADLGDGDDIDGFIDGADLNSAGYTSMGLALTEGTPNTVTGYSAGKTYAADDTVDLKVLNAVDTAVVTVSILVFVP